MSNLVIGDIDISIPIVQGGMGGGYALSGLSRAVTVAGGLGTIGASGLAQSHEESVHIFDCEWKLANTNLHKAIAVNVMSTTPEYELMVQRAVSLGCKILVVGGGLPLNLPALVDRSDVNLVPIVSSLEALHAICAFWKKKYDRVPNGVVVSGANGGGHHPRIDDANQCKSDLIYLIRSTRDYLDANSLNIPVIASGGIGDSIFSNKCLDAGATAIQIGTGFICTTECDADQDVKQFYANSRETVVIKSPSGLYARIIPNTLYAAICRGDFNGMNSVCDGTCIVKCRNNIAQWCLSRSVRLGVKGDLERGLFFAGTSLANFNSVVSVGEIIERFFPDMSN